MSPASLADFSRPWAIVPLRGLEDAKTRLGAELDPEERLELVVGMAERTLASTRDAARLAGTVLVTADPAAGELGTRFGARSIVQQLPGLNAALREARSVAIANGATSVLVVPIDLVAISASAIDEVLAEAMTAAAPATDRPFVGLIPDRHASGTNALLVAPPTAIEPAFGPGSFAAHHGAAEAAGATILVCHGPLTLDVDTGADLLAAEATAGGRDAA